MNPFSRFLSQWSSRPDLDQFVQQWDRLERLLVQVYRRQVTPEDATTDFTAVCTDLRAQYPKWQDDLRPFWQQTKAGGKQTKQDPFALLLEISTPADILGDWQAMQHLPAAREALNQLLLSQSKD